MNLLEAVRNHNIKLMKYYINNTTNINYKSPITGRNCFHDACASGDEEIVKLLLSYKNRVNVNDKCIISGDTPLHYTALSGNIEILLLLIKNGCNINNVNYMNATALHYSKTPQIALELLNNGIDSSIKDKVLFINIIEWKNSRLLF